MRKKIFLFCPLLIMGFFLLFANSCKKNDENEDNNSGLPVLTTTGVTMITDTSAYSGGDITTDGGGVIIARGVCWSTSTTPTIADNKTNDGTGSGDFVSHISGLSANTTYYLRAYATNSSGTAYGNEISFTTQENINYGSFTDTRDGNVYQTVTIGNQEWMAENLKYLPAVAAPGISSQTEPYYYVYGFSDTIVSDAKATYNYTTYGVLYNWTAAMAGSASSLSNPSGIQGVCPTGWHLPSDAEWTELIDYLGTNPGGKLKATGTIEAGTGLWTNPNGGATNETGFNALPGGAIASDGLFVSINESGFWWSTTENNPSWSWYRRMYYLSGDDYRTFDLKDVGFSVRCVKNN